MASRLGYKIFIFFALVLFIFNVEAKISRADNLALKIDKKTNSDDLKPFTVVSEVPAQVCASVDLKKYSEPLKLVALFSLWYAFNAGYNVYNSFMKTDFQKPWITSTIQLVIGMIYAVPLWATGLRTLPKLTLEDIKLLLPIAALNAFGHSAAVCAMFEKGGGSFTHVIKASEPVVSVALNAIINKVIPKPLTGLSLLPITYGVAYASTLGNLNLASMNKELTTKAAKMAMFSNVASSLRSIFRKNLPSDFKSRTNLDPANEHAVTTLLSFLIMIPVVLAFESPSSIVSSFNSIANKKVFLFNTFICSMCFYLYNEMQNKVLGSLGAVPTAVGNTLKRVVIFVALYYFTQGETFPMPKVIGCAIAVLGCLSFAICDSKKL
jgi:solute carrier family 35 protein E1